MGAVQGPFLPFDINNAKVPAEGPRCVRIPLNFATITSYAADLTTLTQGQPNPQMSYIQTLFVDNSENPYALQCLTGVVNQQVVIPPYSQGFVPVLQPNNPKLQFTSAGAGGVAQVFALNFPVSPAVWQVNGNGQFYFNGQSLKVTDVILDALVGNWNGYGNSLAVADLGLQSLIVGGALQVTGAGGGGVSPAVSNTNALGIGLSTRNWVAGVTGKSTYVESFQCDIRQDTYSANAGGGHIQCILSDGQAYLGNWIWSKVIWIPGSAPSYTQMFNGTLADLTGMNYKLNSGDNLYLTFQDLNSYGANGSGFDANVTYYQA